MTDIDGMKHITFKNFNVICSVYLSSLVTGSFKCFDHRINTVLGARIC